MQKGESKRAIEPQDFGIQFFCRFVFLLLAVRLGLVVKCRNLFGGSNDSNCRPPFRWSFLNDSGLAFRDAGTDLRRCGGR